MQPTKSDDLVEHFFRNEYGKILAVISKYIDLDHAEDLVQETLMTATEHWKLNGIPPNPEAWLYKTAKNKAYNYLRKQNNQRKFLDTNPIITKEEIEFSDEQISDDLLRVMLKCCHPSVSSDITITLILKILCGFSISEIAAAFCTNSETINKRLVRGRKKLKINSSAVINLVNLNRNIQTLLQAIYLLFNEGYSPANKHQTTRKDLCLEAIRLAEIIVGNKHVIDAKNAHALLALMYLNCSRFDARRNEEEGTIEIEFQDRSLWNKDLINKGLYHMDQVQQNNFISKYLILAGISGNHCIAQTFQETDWKEILSLYDALLTIENTAIVRLNRIVALSKVKGPSTAITELQQLKGLNQNHLLYSVYGQLKKELGELDEAISYYKKAIQVAPNPRDKTFLSKKLNALVPISKTHV